MSARAFLAEYWQKKPLLIRGAFPGWASPLEPEELAGLALEPDVRSRIVRETGADPPWELRHGPFAEADFTSLPAARWTLLVQGVNHHLPEVAALLDRFRFIPNWRLDDVMVSYAAPGGSVGPHTDSYDVFLLQGLGRRRWAIGEAGPVRLIPDLELQVIADFKPTREWVLGPGDMLYLPPGVPHFGVAEGACMTYSVGFRAPTDQELMAGVFGEAIAHADPAARYGDPDLTPAASPGRIDPAVFARVRAMLRAALADDRALDDWFGRHVTTPGADLGPDPDQAAPDTAAILAHLHAGGTLERAGWSRWAYAGGPPCRLFVNGEALAVASPELAALLCDGGPLDGAALAPFLGHAATGALLAALAGMGALEPA